MKLQRAIEILEEHQSWRLGSDEETHYTTKELTEAINLVLIEIKRKN
jgi:hypothetical protein